MGVANSVTTVERLTRNDDTKFWLDKGQKAEYLCDSWFLENLLFYIFQLSLTTWTFTSRAMSASADSIWMGSVVDESTTGFEAKIPPRVTSWWKFNRSPLWFARNHNCRTRQIHIHGSPSHQSAAIGNGSAKNPHQNWAWTDNGNTVAQPKLEFRATIWSFSYGIEPYLIGFNAIDVKSNLLKSA